MINAVSNYLAPAMACLLLTLLSRRVRAKLADMVFVAWARLDMLVHHSRPLRDPDVAQLIPPGQQLSDGNHVVLLPIPELRKLRRSLLDPRLALVPERRRQLVRALSEELRRRETDLRLSGCDSLYIRGYLLAYGQPAILSPTPLSPGETAYCCVRAKLARFRTHSRYVSDHQSVTVPVAGIRLRFGTRSGRRISERLLTPIDTGWLILTDRRNLFWGAQKSVSAYHSSGTVISPLVNGLEIRQATRENVDVFLFSPPAPFIINRQFLLDRLAARSRVTPVRSVARRTTRVAIGSRTAQPVTPVERDIFLCHASGDKDDFVRGLYQALVRARASVWFDEAEIDWGDDIRLKIEEGLRSSRIGLVVISKAFIGRRWPESELSALTDRQISGRALLLPIWHNVTKDDVADAYPRLSLVKALESSAGEFMIANKVLQKLASIKREGV